MSEYDLLNKNCCHFCEARIEPLEITRSQASSVLSSSGCVVVQELCELLGVGPLPSRAEGSASVLARSTRLSSAKVQVLTLKVASTNAGQAVLLGSLFLR